MSTPAHTVLSVQQSLTKNWRDPRAPPSLFTESRSSDLFCVSPDKKVLKGKCFANVEEVKQKVAEALKASKSMNSKTILSSGKNHLDRSVASNGQYFEGD